MTGIFVKREKGENMIFLNINFIREHHLKPQLVDFINYLIPIQVQKGIDEWLILKLDDTSEKFNIPRPTLCRYLKQLEQENILIQESFRSVLWKINPNIITVIG